VLTNQNFVVDPEKFDKITISHSFRGRDLRLAVLYLANLRKTDFTGALLQGANLRGAQLQGANLQRVRLQSADLQEAQLQDANLDQAQLQGANLDYAQLQGASLDRAQLQGASLSAAQLQGAWLHLAELQSASLDNVSVGARPEPPISISPTLRISMPTRHRGQAIKLSASGAMQLQTAFQQSFGAATG
jgi:Pentapeptide repeats (8 copies)